MKEHFGTINGVRLCWFESHPELASGETCLLLHATGFHARCWDAVVKVLGPMHVIALDLRGHGRSENTGPFTWDTFGADVAAFVQELDLTEIVGVGHSMGGHCLVQAAYQAPNRFTRLVLVDPVIMDPDLYRGVSEQATFVDSNGAHPVARRKNRFDDAEAMFQNFAGRGSYGLWRESILRDYCKHGLVPSESGVGFVLACPPEVEAAIYLGSTGRNIHHMLQEITQPVTVLRAQRKEEGGQMDFSRSPTWPGLAAAFPDGVDIFLPHLSHFIPMQDPALVASHIVGDHA